MGPPTSFSPTPLYSQTSSVPGAIGEHQLPRCPSISALHLWVSAFRGEPAHQQRANLLRRNTESGALCEVSACDSDAALRGLTRQAHGRWAKQAQRLLYASLYIRQALGVVRRNNAMLAAPLGTSGIDLVAGRRPSLGMPDYVIHNALNSGGNGLRPCAHIHIRLRLDLP